MCYTHASSMCNECVDCCRLQRINLLKILQNKQMKLSVANSSHLTIMYTKSALDWIICVTAFTKHHHSPCHPKNGHQYPNKNPKCLRMATSPPVRVSILKGYCFSMLRVMFVVLRNFMPTHNNGFQVPQLCNPVLVQLWNLKPIIMC